MLLTNDPSVFREAVRPGDVVTFDSTGFDAGLVQWADRVPVNHAALVLDAATFVEANRVDGRGPDTAVREVRIGARLVDPAVRTVTLLRHAEATGDQVEAVLGEARRYLARHTDFAYLRLIALGPLALRRSYPGTSSSPVSVELLAWLLARLAEAAQRLSASGAWSLTCSEFVYRCYSAGGLRLPVLRPLDVQVDGATAQLWATVQQHNAAAVPGDKYAALSGGVDADRITPGDLQRCDLLLPVAVLHLPLRRPDDPGGEGEELG